MSGADICRDPAALARMAEGAAGAEARWLAKLSGLHAGRLGWPFEDCPFTVAQPELRATWLYYHHVGGSAVAEARHAATLDLLEGLRT